MDDPAAPPTDDRGGDWTDDRIQTRDETGMQEPGSLEDVFDPESQRPVAVDQDGASLFVDWADGRRSTYPAVWLRDNCQEADSRDRSSGQRLFDISALPDEIGIADARMEAGMIAVHYSPDGHLSQFAPAWLYRHRLDDEALAERCEARRPTLWDGTLTESLPEADFGAVRSDKAALALWLAGVRQYGFALLHDVPKRAGMVTEVAQLFGFVRETNYGRLFDVVATPDPINLAYTGLALGVHTDNPYRDPVPGLQLLHCLDTDAEGGDSVLVDGFMAAEYLRREAPEDFALLTRHPVPFRYRAATTDLESRGRLIETDPDGEVMAVRYNNRSAAPVELPAAILPRFYDAYRRFGRVLARPELAVTFRLDPGDLFMVDNRRVLHGRTGYRSAGRRHLQGCYADKDALNSFVRVHGEN